ncbi:alpha/beta fold hydrolase [Streptomyces sp. NPDC052101]|uniref:thioesterase II family protein n=1 Tax=Streptomyces sp. NPDC052101 TaxID=3155763 RepID=UPI003416FC13
MELRLFVFHHAGGSHLPYRGWPDRFPADWEIRLMDAPGRGRLGDLAALGDAAALVEYFRRELDGELVGPFALFGHSMGGIVAYELTRALLAEGRTPPVWLGLSARATPLPDGGVRRDLMSDAELRRELVRMGGTPTEILDDPDMWAYFAPTIRSDLRLVDTWRPALTDAPLPVPLSVYGGAQDAVTPPARLAGWARQSTRFLGLRLFEGGHFYFLDDPGPLTERITDDIRTALAPAGPAAARPR